MFTRILIVIVVALPLTVFAAEPTPAEQAVAFCEAKYPGTDATARLKQVLCIQDQNIRILEARIKKGEQGLASEVERLRKELAAARAAPAAPASTASRADIAAARAAIARRAEELKRAKPAPAAPLSARPVVPPPMPPPVVGGVPYRVIPTPGQFAGSTYDIDGPRLHIRLLKWGAEQHVRGATEVRIVVKRDGMPLTIEHTGGPILGIRADLNGDGKVDRVAYSAIDPDMIDDLYVPQVGSMTRIELVFLVPTGKTVEVPGLPPQPLWGDPVRVKYDRVPRFGRWLMEATSGMEL